MKNNFDIIVNDILEEKSTLSRLAPVVAAGLAAITPLDSEAAKKDNKPKAEIQDVYHGIPNNNPGNIKYNPNIKWQGTIGTNKGFLKFDSMENGIRAMTRILRVYDEKYNLNTIRGIITRWSPRFENDTDRYIKFISGKISAHPDQKLDLNDTNTMHSLINAIIKFETGTTVPPEQISKGIEKEKRVKK